MKRENNTKGANSRVVRYSKKNRLKRKIKRSLKKVGLNLLRNIICLIVGLVYAAYLLIRGFNNLIAKLFMKLPRITRVSIIYLLILGTGLALKNSFKGMEFEISTNIFERVGVPVVVEGKCTREHETSCKIEEKGKELGLTKEQINISIAISRWETGTYTSNLFLNSNNLGGFYRNGAFVEYETLEEGIDDYIRTLKYCYFDKGLTTLEQIKLTYCPDGVDNDPNNLNPNWLPGVKKMYELEAK